MPETPPPPPVVVPPGGGGPIVSVPPPVGPHVSVGFGGTEPWPVTPAPAPGKVLGVVLVPSPSPCVPIPIARPTDQAHPGEKNPPELVARVQAFLRIYENENISITGFFDNPTIEAVTRFQIKYANDILAPLGLKHPTGHAAASTIRKMNQIACGINQPLPAHVMRTVLERQTQALAALKSRSQPITRIPTSTPTPLPSTAPTSSTVIIETAVAEEKYLPEGTGSSLPTEQAGTPFFATILIALGDFFAGLMHFAAAFALKVAAVLQNFLYDVLS
ncbi:MAG: peptidoglycan-binding protein [Candidatus Liptonbacteria bacterium]|nr:peptidoglycan-binding protein [Candidatus Liptonbacteria bacterium]